MGEESTKGLQGNTVLVVDDHGPIRHLIADYLGGLGCQVDVAEGGKPALKLMAERRYDLVLLDLRMKDMTGLEVLEQARAKSLAKNYVMMSAEGTVSSAVRAIHLGASDFLVKPFDLEQLTDSVSRILRPGGGAEGPTRDPRLAWRDRVAPYIVGDHPALLDVFLIIDRISHSDCTVLISGESGTGKELIAQAIHDASPRKKHDVVAVNCGAIPESLIESELFGHSRGAFTGATTAREGRFAAAEKGTLFLDEIGEMSLAVQVKFLRVLQERKYTPVGETKPRESDVRIVAATNKDLAALVQEHKFRDDLYWRLNVIPIQIPALRERRSDIPDLVRHFVASIRAKAAPGTLVPDFSPAALEVLQAQDWPGNIRQLEHAIERLVVLNPRERPLEVEDLGPQFQPVRPRTPPSSDTPPTTTSPESSTPAHPPSPVVHREPEPSTASNTATPEPTQIASLDGLKRLRLPQEGIDLRSALEALEWSMIDQALELSAGKRKQAAHLLGLNRTTLVEKLRKRSAKEQREQAAENPKSEAPNTDEAPLRGATG